MTFDYPGYELKFVQKRPCKDGSPHLFTLIFKFYSPVTKYFYILHADYHAEDVFAIKFYAKPHRKSEFKYSKITNRKDLGNILVTCAKAIPLLLLQYPNASFGFAAARSIDKKTKKVEDLPSNQRFETYRYIIKTKFGTKTFAHFDYPRISSYLLVNKNCGDVEEKEQALKTMFQETYNTLLDIQ